MRKLFIILLFFSCSKKIEHRPVNNIFYYRAVAIDNSLNQIEATDSLNEREGNIFSSWNKSESVENGQRYIYFFFIAHEVKRVFYFSIQDSVQFKKWKEVGKLATNGSNSSYTYFNIYGQ